MTPNPPACPQCGALLNKPAGHINRAARVGAPIYCGRVCMGLARRAPVVLTAAEKREVKADYDMRRRTQQREVIRAKKRAYFQRTYDPIQAAIVRAKRMPLHVEYCRRPAYKAKKSEYDRRHRAEKMFGEFAPAFLQLLQVEKEINSQASRYEVYRANGTLNKAQTRRRAL